ncbi:hypothetical protein SH528x_004947 [Novipirellula sp. SH528]|uniref:hypothetical protein n=1 Tax=Novipirellula sp. SH528 TaxID=3454466 RepID=UPI003FA0AC07
MGDTGFELIDKNAVNCGAKPQGDVSAVASAVALRPIPSELVDVIQRWEAEHGRSADSAAGDVR